MAEALFALIHNFAACSIRRVQYTSPSLDRTSPRHWTHYYFSSAFTPFADAIMADSDAEWSEKVRQNYYYAFNLLEDGFDLVRNAS